MKSLAAIVLTVLIFLLGAAMQGVRLHVFFDVPAFVMILGPLSVYLVHSQGFAGAMLLMKRVFSNQANESDVYCVRGLVAFGFILGGMGTVVGVVVTMGLLDQGTEVIGRAIGHAFVSTVIGALPALLLLPLSTRAMKDTSLLKIAAAYSGFIVTSSFGIFSFMLWILGDYSA